MDTTDPNDPHHSTIPLRASCDRCRAHKLRCVPSTTSETKAPCQRCLKAAIPDACVFGRTGRYRKNTVDQGTGSSGNHAVNILNNNTNHTTTNNNKSNKMGSKTRSTSSVTRGTTPVFPGMSTFSLPNSSHSTNSSSHGLYKDANSTGSSDQTHCAMSYINEEQGLSYPIPTSTTSTTNHIDDVLDMFPASWERDSSMVHPSLHHLGGDSYTQQPQSSDLYLYSTSVMLSESEENNNNNHHNNRSGSSSHMESSLMSMPPTPKSGYTMDFSSSQTSMNIDSSTSNSSGKPGPLNELAVLLAEMPLYEDRLSRHAHGNLLTYPIGDALFLTLRFRAILGGRNELLSNTTSSEEGMPAMLLTLSCYMTLVTIYLSIFNYFSVNLSMILAGSDARYNTPNHCCTADRYRGLRLDQLQPICLCAGWNPIKKAVLMLLCSLSCTEEILGLPRDARVTVKPPDEFRGAHEVWFEAGEGKCAIFDEGSMKALMNSGLYKDSRRRAMELRDKVKEVEGLVVGVSEKYAIAS